jgi:hypothetical protein
MATKPPSSISSKWWKDNIPSTMPRDKALEALIKEVEAFDIGKFEKAIKAEAAELGDKSTKMDLKTNAPKIADLVTGLDRYAGLLIKDKHAAVADGVRTMSSMAEKLLKKVGKISSEASAAYEKAKGKTDTKVKSVEANANDLMRRLKSARTAAAQIKTSAAAADDRDSLENAIGKNRFLQSEVKTIRMKITRLETLQADFLASTNGAEARLLITACDNGFDAILKDAVASDKVLLTKAVQVLGQKEARKFFLDAAPIAVKLG